MIPSPKEDPLHHGPQQELGLCVPVRGEFRAKARRQDPYSPRRRILSPSTEGLLTQFVGEDRLKKMREETMESLVERIQERLRQFAARELKRDPKTLKKVASIQVVYGDPAAEILKKRRTSMPTS